MNVFVGNHLPVTPTAGQIRMDNTYNMQVFDGNNWVPFSAVMPEDVNINSHTLDTGYELFGDCGYWVQFKFNAGYDYQSDINHEVKKWTEQTYGPMSAWGTGRYCGSSSKYYFKDERDRDWFVMRWSS
jgi:hypothetical protein